ncbi:hypothetical protein DENSPDRAFT_280238 [Dentipellis sp. KUC8613]|nr:hypothetical protein DENSPDRAFT_280238 [Dentipellis sp. KUC8613]
MRCQRQLNVFLPQALKDNAPSTMSDLRCLSGSSCSRILLCERVPVIDNRGMRSEQRAMQTLKIKRDRTQTHDLGYDATPGLFTNGYLSMLMRGPNRLLPMTKAGNNSQVNVGKKNQSWLSTPARGKHIRRRISPSYNIPPVIKTNTGRFGCPQVGCHSTHARECDARRHYLYHHQARVWTRIVWLCTRCGRRFVRYDDAIRHFRRAHTRRPREEEIVMIRIVGA